MMLCSFLLIVEFGEFNMSGMFELLVVISVGFSGI